MRNGVSFRMQCAHKYFSIFTLSRFDQQGQRPRVISFAPALLLREAWPWCLVWCPALGSRNSSRLANAARSSCKPLDWLRWASRCETRILLRKRQAGATPNSAAASSQQDPSSASCAIRVEIFDSAVSCVELVLPLQTHPGAGFLKCF